MLRVRVLGAICELRPHESLSSPGIDVREFADLDDGRRVFWREDRGWSSSTKFSHSSWPVHSGHQMMFETVIVIESDDRRADSYVESALSGLGVKGVDVDPASVYSAPFIVEQGPHLKAELQKVARLFDPPTSSRSRHPRSLSATHDFETGSVVDYAVVMDSGQHQAGLQINIPESLYDHLDQYCLEHQVAKSTVVRLLIESHLQRQ